MRRIAQMDSVADIIIQSVLSNTRFIIVIGEIGSKLVDKEVDEHRLREIKGASKTTAGTDRFIE